MKTIGEILKGKSDSQTDHLFTLMYDDLRRLATSYLQNEPRRAKLSSASLVHQAYVRMVDQSKVSWQGKTHFFAVGATVMRRILVDHARKVKSLKRGGQWRQRQLHDEITFQLNEDEDVVALDDLLTKLATLHCQQAKIVELRFFGGLTMTEIASELSVSLRTIEKEWAMARAWMRRELRRSAEKPVEQIESSAEAKPDEPSITSPRSKR
ncbi:sigma-70 family RNA polymerase sigma factor [bacterium]|nr:sigma-70 family RNA polymerase sigma factor [bacterium]